MSHLHPPPPLPSEDSGATLYELLEVDPTASPDAIRRAYKKQAARWHPDRHPDGPAKTIATTAFQRVAEAYEILRDPNLRHVYDAQGLEAVRHGGGGCGDADDDAWPHRTAASGPRQHRRFHGSSNDGAEPFYVFSALDPFEVFRMAFGRDFDASMFARGDPFFGSDDDGFGFGGFGEALGNMDRFFGFPEMDHRNIPHHDHRSGLRGIMQQRSIITETRGNQRFVRTVVVDSDPITGERRETTSGYVEDLSTGQRQALPEPLNQNATAAPLQLNRHHDALLVDGGVSGNGLQARRVTDDDTSGMHRVAQQRPADSRVRGSGLDGSQGGRRSSAAAAAAPQPLAAAQSDAAPLRRSQPTAATKHRLREDHTSRPQHDDHPASAPPAPTTEGRSKKRWSSCCCTIS